jgi:hypothetical protein
MTLPILEVEYEFTINFGDYRFGFVDVEEIGGRAKPYTLAEIGPLGTFHVPISAMAAWCVVAAALLLVAGLVATFSRRKKSS